MVFALARPGSGAKLSSAGLWLNASKSESVLEGEAQCLLLFRRIEIGRESRNHTGERLVRWLNTAAARVSELNFKY